jgi:hypothetical protein
MGKCYLFYVIYHLALSTVLLGVLASTVKVRARGSADRGGKGVFDPPPPSMFLPPSVRR